MSGGIAELENQSTHKLQFGAPLPSLTEGFRAAALALADMQQHRVLPTPRAYELWLAYRSNANPALTTEIAAKLKTPESLTPAVIDTLREEFAIDTLCHEDEAETELSSAVSASLSESAQALADNAKDGRAAIRDYGDALARGVSDLGAVGGWDEALRVIATLTASTRRAVERNTQLENQLGVTTEKVERLQRLLAAKRKVASTDQLTGLASRREFEVRMRRKLRKINTDPTMPASLLMLDIDHFKRFNDNYGHRVGDLVLRLVGRLLIDSIKGRDLAARYGGEEFAILLVGADLPAAAKVARQICTTLELKRVTLSTGSEHGRGRVTVSIGVAQFRPADTVATIVERADTALYAAKHAGRNRVMIERELPGADL